MGYSQKGKQGFQSSHCLSKHPLYGTWKRIKARCYNTKCKDYKDYGGRGITICTEWRDDFVEFLYWSLKHGWWEGASIERVDNDKGYSPENCKWIPRAAQAWNKSNSHFVTAFGETKTIGEWAASSGLKYDTIERRINAYGWSPEDAVSIKPHRKSR